jgi:hypothetical protein
VMIELGNLAREQTPLMVDLGRAAPGLDQLVGNLPKFNDASKDSLKSLGNASEVGQRALTKSREEIAELERTAEKSVPAADILADFLENLDDPRNAVEETCFARRDLREQPGEADRRVALLEQKLNSDLQGVGTCPFLPGTGGPNFTEAGTGNPGYTGLESLLNYGYIQTISLNLFTEIGHALHINIVGIEDAAEGADEGCGHHSETLNHSIARAPEIGAGHTQDARDALRCTGYLGDYQPGRTPGTCDPATGRALGLPRYDKSVCPDGSTWLTICDPALTSPRTATALGPQEQVQAQTPAAGGGPLDDVLKKLPNLKDLTPKQIRDILGLPPGSPIPSQPGLPSVPGVPPLGAGQQSTAPELLNFLFGP